MKIINNVRNIAISLVLIIPVISFADVGTALSEKDRNEFIRQGIPSCINGQKKQPIAKFIDQSDIEYYCKCTMTRSTDFITLEDLGKIFQSKSFDHLKPIIEISGAYCTKVLMKKWGIDP